MERNNPETRSESEGLRSIKLYRLAGEIIDCFVVAVWRHNTVGLVIGEARIVGEITTEGIKIKIFI